MEIIVQRVKLQRNLKRVNHNIRKLKVNHLGDWKIPGRNAEYHKWYVKHTMFQMVCGTVSPKEMGIQGAGQGTSDVSRVSKTKVKRKCMYMLSPS